MSNKENKISSAVCKMCLCNKKLIDAHIIPAGFYRYMKSDDDSPFEIRSSEKGEHKKRSYTGLYDNNILCEDCEKLFQKYDDYAQKFLLPDPGNPEFILNPSGKKVGYKLNNVNYGYLKLFFLSVLWRASVSVRKEFSKVDAGPFENELKKMILNNDPGKENIFSVVMMRFNDFLGKNFLLNPHKIKVDSFNHYIFYLGAGYKIYIKVDRRPLTGDLAALILKRNSPFYVPFLEDLSMSKEFSVLCDIVKNNATK